MVKLSAILPSNLKLNFVYTKNKRLTICLDKRRREKEKIIFLKERKGGRQFFFNFMLFEKIEIKKVKYFILFGYKGRRKVNNK